MKSNIFFAVHLSDAAREAVHSDAQKWQGATRPSAARWYAPEDYHVTLKFLGAHEPCEIDAFVGRIGEQVAQSWAGAARGDVPVAIAGAGVFPSLQSPRVLWAGVRSSEALVALAAQIDESCAELGVPLEYREYKPHVTLARIRETRGKSEFFELPSDLFQSVPKFDAAQFFLMQTSAWDDRKLHGKLRYNIVHTFDLALPR